MHLSTKEPEYFLFQEHLVLIPSTAEKIRPLNQNEWDNLNLSEPEIIQFGGSQFAVEIESANLPEHTYSWKSLRTVFNTIGDEQFTPWSQASQLLTWLKTHKYCGRCGSKTTPHPTEFARLCLPCNEVFYPRISPCVIVLITKGDYILLGRAAKFKKKLYSTLAGFIEVGESAEEAIHREIREEVSLRVHNLTYFGSQPWPFPGQLMIGYFAEYRSGEIQVDGKEIMDAQWFHISDLPAIPISETIAGQLIRTYIKKR
jgi:NAD+ diphosphatase